MKTKQTFLFLTLLLTFSLSANARGFFGCTEGARRKVVTEFNPYKITVPGVRLKKLKVGSQCTQVQKCVGGRVYNSWVNEGKKDCDKRLKGDVLAFSQKDLTVSFRGCWIAGTRHGADVFVAYDVGDLIPMIRNKHQMPVLFTYRASSVFRNAYSSVKLNKTTCGNVLQNLEKVREIMLRMGRKSEYFPEQQKCEQDLKKICSRLLKL